MSRRIGWCMVAMVAVHAAAHPARADRGFDAEAGLGAGRAWGSLDTAVKDVRLAAGGRFDVGRGLTFHAGLAVDLVWIRTVNHDERGFVELGAYTALRWPLSGGWSVGPRLAFAAYERPLLFVGVRLSHRHVSFGVDGMRMFAETKPTGFVASASLTGRPAAWVLGGVAVVALLIAAAGAPYN